MNYAPSDILFSVGSVTVYWYGLLVALGIAACYAICSLLIRRHAGSLCRDFDRIFILTFIAGVIGARAVFVLYHLDYFKLYPQEVIAVWHGGWVWHGGLVAGVLAVAAYCRVYRLSFLTFGDLFAPGILVGQAVGRIGNYFNQEAYGLSTSLPWGIPIDLLHRVPGYEQATHFHPTFAYEIALNVCIASVLFFVLRKEGRFTAGSGFSVFLWAFLYSIGRFFIEFLRVDTVPVLMGLRMPQWISVVSVAILVFWLTRVAYRPNSDKIRRY